MKNFHVPQSRDGKIKFLKSLMNGQATIEDLKETAYDISMWREEDDPEYMECFFLKSSKETPETFKWRMTKKEYEESTRAKDTMYVTFDLNQ